MGPPIDMLFQQLAVCITQVIGPDSETTSNVTSGEVGKLIQWSVAYDLRW